MNRASRHRRPRIATAAILTLITACAAPIPGGGPGTSRPAPQAAPTAAGVDWDDATGREFTPLSAGLNVYAATSDIVAAKASYARNLAGIGAGVVRFHYGGLLNDASSDARGWTNRDAIDTPDAGWDAARIARVMDAADAWSRYDGYAPERLVTIPGFPAWMKRVTARIGRTSSAGLLDPSEWDRFASFCAALVRILNVDQHRGIKYFEVLNELDPEYYGRFRKAGETDDRLNEMVEIYNRAATAMKAVDPGIRVGGPALEWPDRFAEHRRFVRGTRDHLDFLSYHFYATGNASASDDAVLNAVTGYSARVAAGLRRVLDEEIPGRAVPLFLTEYNIQYDWRNRDARMTNAFGAAFDALTIATAASAGVNLTAAWNDRDGVYGKLDNDANDTPRPAANGLRLAAATLPGRIVRSSGDARVTAFATKNPVAHRRTLLLVNRSGEPVNARVDFHGWTPEGATVRVQRLRPDGTLERDDAAFTKVRDAGVGVAAHALTVLEFDDARP